METPIARRRFTVEDYHRMAEARILHEDDRVELIEGEIVEMTPIGGRHVNCVSRLTRAISRFAGDRYLVNVQSPVRLGRTQEPQPDLALVRDRHYGGSLPGSDEVLILIEVTDTSLPYDRNVKLPLYARAGIPEVWIVDLKGEKIERHTDPSGGGYRRVEQGRRGEEIESTVLPELVLSADAVLI